MKAIAVFPGQSDTVHLADLKNPSVNDVPNGRGVLVRILKVGVDGTDKEINAAEYGAAPNGYEFLVIGHEGFGQVEEVGPNVIEFKPGDIQLIQNHVILHDRTDYEDWPEPERKRHLLRLWLCPPNGRPLPPAFDQSNYLDQHDASPVPDLGATVSVGVGQRVEQVERFDLLCGQPRRVGKTLR